MAVPFSTYAQCEQAWQGPHTPPVMWEHEMVVDTARQRIVMPCGAIVSGAGSNDVHNNVYEWDGLSWRGKNPTGPRPAPRGSYGLAFDAARGVTILFGGGDFSGHLFGDTWAWDGRRWALLTTTGPTARESVAMTYHAAGQTVLLFGGRTAAGLSGETWAWDGESWTLAAVTGPSARQYATVSYDPVRERTVLFGGYNTAARNDTFEWSGEGWSRVISSTNPTARSGANMLWNPATQRTVLYGGAPSTSGSPLDTKVWSFDGTTWTPTPHLPGFEQRWLSASAFDPHTQQILLFGGLRSQSVTDARTWALQDSTWIVAAQSPPAFTYGQPMAYDSVGQRVIMLDTSTWAWGQNGWVNLGPCPQGGNACAFDSHRARIVALSSADGATWEFDGATWMNREVDGPGPRGKPIMGFDPVRHVTILHGGVRDGQPLGDTWEWDGSTWRMVATDGPVRTSTAGAFDAARGMLVAFGGLRQPSDGVFGDTWGWNGATWTLLSTGGPSPRYAHAMTYDPLGQRVLLLSGFASTHNADDLWEWNGADWRQLVATGPGPRRYASIGFDAARGELLLFGGSPPVGHEYLDTWTFRPDAAVRIIAQSPRQRLCRGQTLTLTAQAEPGTPVTYQWRRWECDDSRCIEANLADGPTPFGAVIAGANGPVLTIANVGPDDQTNYRCLITSDCNSAFSQPVFVGVCVADFDCSGDLSLQDLFAFLTAWFAGSPTADINGIDSVTVLDIFDFLNSYFVGCP